MTRHMMMDGSYREPIAGAERIMGATIAVYDWVAVLHERGDVWDIGQLLPADKRRLDREVKQGRALKFRDWWQGLGHPRSHWISCSFGRLAAIPVGPPGMAQGA